MSIKMVKSKRDVTTPRKRASLTKKTITKISGRPGSSTTTVPSANIKVVVRVRPPNEREQGENSKLVVKILDEQMLIFDPREEAQPFFYHGVQQKNRDLLKKANKHLQFVFDNVFRETSSNYEVFENSTQSLINTLMDGYNCSVFAYGATGAGKTFTMIGTEATPGITFLTMTELFKRKDDLSNERDFELGISYLEVYNELVKDLLNPGSPLHLREDGKYGVMVSGIKVHKIVNPDELFILLAQGNKNRTQHPTDANAESSRSHAVFQVYIQMTVKTTREVRTAKLSMIDLAGSERGSATGFTGARFTEGANINKSLLALGNCINSLADGQRHVPYRDSKLTRLLKDSLGGNCQTVMIANVSPSSLSFEDTYNTLKYAMRAKKIKSNMKRNVVNVEMHIGQYVKMVEDLRKENAALKLENEALKKEKEECATVTTEPTQTEENVTNIEVPTIDPEFIAEIRKLCEEKKTLIERKYQIESTQVGMNLRRNLKEESDTRLSALCIETPEKLAAHRKINSAVDRFRLKESALKVELEDIEKDMRGIDEEINKLVEQNPELESVTALESKNLEVTEYENKHLLDVKKIELLLDDHKENCTLLEKMACVLKPCYVRMRNHGFVSSELSRDYDELVLDFKGRKNIKWGDMPDSGVSSSTSLNDEENRASKRKIEEGASTDSLDNTFTVPSPRKPKVQLCAQQVMAKVYIKPSTPKRLNGKSPRNDCRVRKPLERIDGAKRLASNRPKVNVKGTTASKSMAERPPFRR